MDDFAFARNGVASARVLRAVVPSDTVDLLDIPKAIFVGTGGNVALIGADSSSSSTGIILKNVPSGTMLAISPRRILATGTTATDILAMYSGGPGYASLTAAPAVAVPALPTISIVGPVSKTEGSTGTTSLVFTLTRSTDVGSACVGWAVTATGANPAAADDFVGGTFPAGAAFFRAGETSTTITVPVSGDGTSEQDETFAVILNSPSIGHLLGTSIAIGTILNDDAAAGAPTGYRYLLALDNSIFTDPNGARIMEAA